MSKCAVRNETVELVLEPVMTDVTFLPTEVVYKILKYLGPNDILNACRACKEWGAILDSQYLWRSFNLNYGLITRSDIDCFERFGHHIKKLQVVTDTARISKQRTADFSNALKELVKSDFRLQSLQLMNAGKLEPYIRLEIYEATVKMLKWPRPKRQSSWSSDLVEVNFQLGSLDVIFPVDRLLHRIGKHHQKLQRLTIDWRPSYWLWLGLHLNYDASGILHVVNNCRQLTHLDLAITPPALCAGVLDALGSEDRQQLRYISIAFLSNISQMNPNNVIDLTPDVWRSFSARQPSVEVGMTIQVNLTITVRNLLTAHGLDIAGVLNVSRLQMMLSPSEADVLASLQAIGDVFANSLTTCVLEFTAAMRPPIEEALVRFSAQCLNLSEFYVRGFGIQTRHLKLSPDNVAAILAAHPMMQRNNTYHLLSR